MGEIDVRPADAAQPDFFGSLSGVPRAWDTPLQINDKWQIGSGRVPFGIGAKRWIAPRRLPARSETQAR